MGSERNIQSNEKQGPTTKNVLPSKVINRIEGRIKSFPVEKILKEFIITKPLLYEMLKELISEKEDQNYEQ